MVRGLYYNNRIIPSSIKTKRYCFNFIVDTVDEWVNSGKGIVNDNCISIIGLRRIGKTTLLRQICEYYNDRNIAYLDGSEFNGDIAELYWDKDFQKIDIVCVDEVCKFDEDNKAELISLIKNGFKNKFFILTGSTPVVVRYISDNICDGYNVELPPITYAEHLVWKYNVKLTDVFYKSTYSQFLFDLTANKLTDSQVIKYLSGIVNDSYDSYYKRCQSRFADIIEHLRISNDIKDFFTYVASCQMLHQVVSKSGFQITSDFKIVSDKSIMTVEEEHLLKEKINSLKGFRQSTPPHLITQFCLMLKDAGLLHEVQEYNTSVNNIIQDTGVPAYLFEFPQIIMNYFEQSSIYRDLQPMWVEYSLLNAVARIYNTAGKYRTDVGTSEVDCVYGIGDLMRNKHCIIEVKDRPHKNIKIKQYKNIELQNIQEFIITTSDTVFSEIANLPYPNSYFIRGDLLLLLYEVFYLENNGLPMGYEKLLTTVELFHRYIDIKNIKGEL